MLKPIKRTETNPLEVITASTLMLYMTAKTYHLNVTGPTFYGDHKTYDGIAEMAIEWYDTLAERMRALELVVPSTPSWVLETSIVGEGTPSLGADGMLEAMLTNLETFSRYINNNLKNFDPTTQNMAQELDAQLGKFTYFIRSSM